MDFSDSTKTLFDRIQRLEPENYIKIIGFLLLQDNSEREMIRLAFSPDITIQSVINKAKTRLGLSVNKRVEKRPEPTHFTAIGPRANRRSPVGVCQYFIKGFCKHGSQCRFIHSHTMNGDFDGEDDDKLSTGSVEKLEREITELLKLRRGYPVSIAALPMLYYENYGKTLTAEGYLTESQRHGKAGYSLTRLLARLNSSIRIIDRPHGQHAVILAEDFPKHMECTGNINEHGEVVPGSRQIYLTFPAESNFSEQDVANYFSKFGIVQDVRIPCQQKRMFGFVTFAFAETVRHILAKGNPHFVCGSRVLVKPYREKSMLVDRHMNYADKFQHPMYNDASHFLDAETDLHLMPRVIENSRFIRRKLLEEHAQMIEFESRRISNLNLAGKSLTENSFFSYKTDEFIPSLRAQAGQLDFESNDQFNYLPPDTADEIAREANTKYNEEQSGQAVNLPDSPFASGIGGGISTAI